MQTRNQRLAQIAFQQVKACKESKTAEGFTKYASFAKKFPSLIHACGLAQALAFAQAKEKSESTSYLEGLATVVAAIDSDVSSKETLIEKSVNNGIAEYIQVSRNSLSAASWIKRYVEALTEKTDSSTLESQTVDEANSAGGPAGELSGTEATQ